MKTADAAIARAKRAEWFVHDRFGMFIHWGLYSVAARHEWAQNHEKLTAEQYQKYFDRFDPDLYNPREWARLAREAGMKYFVITAKHHEGFCLWDSQFTDFKSTGAAPGKDLLKPMVEAFRAEGLKVGIYYSLLDWHHPEFPVDRLHPQRDDQTFRQQQKHRDIRKYAEYMRQQVRELLTGFGKIDVVWFDYSYPGEDGKGHDDWESEKLVKLVRQLQPDVLLDNRLDLPGSGDFETPEQFAPRQGVKDKDGKPVIWEACQTFSGSWGYHRDEMSWREPEELIGALIDCVSKDGNLLLNVGPTARGEFDGRARDRLAAFAEWMKRHSRAIYGCGSAPAELACPPGCALTYNVAARRLYLHLLAWPYKHVTLQGKAYVERVKYAQFLHDGSEVLFKALDAAKPAHHIFGGEDAVTITLPQMKPPVAVPVVELFLD